MSKSANLVDQSSAVQSHNKYFQNIQMFLLLCMLHVRERILFVNLAAGVYTLY